MPKNVFNILLEIIDYIYLAMYPIILIQLNLKPHGHPFARLKLNQAAVHEVY